LNEEILKLYLDDEYISKNPSLDVQDTSWKVSKIIPLIDTFISDFDKEAINMLDVGGGAGLICSQICTYIRKTYNRKINKFFLDLSPGILEIQKKNNPDFKLALNEDVRKTSLHDKQIDLTLIIDVLEHIPNPEIALREIRRITKFAIFKVPLENNLYNNIRNILTRGRQGKDMRTRFGHINFYSFKEIKRQIETHNGKIISFYFTNTFRYYNNSDFYRERIKTLDKFVNILGELTFKLSPKVCSLIFPDFVMILVRS